MDEGSLEEFLLRLDSVAPGAGAVDTVWAFSIDFFSQNGFDQVVYLRQYRDGLFQKTTLGAEWSLQYEARNWARIDPFLSICCQSYRPIATGIDYLARHDVLSLAQREMIGVAGELGLRAGFSVTTRAGPCGGAAGWNLGSTAGARKVEALRRGRMDRLRLAASHACAALFRHHGASLGAALSAREREALALVAGGLRTKQIAHSLGVTPGAIELYLRNARKKLGAATREQAVALAMAGGHLQARDDLHKAAGPPRTEPEKSAGDNRREGVARWLP